MEVVESTHLSSSHAQSGQAQQPTVGCFQGFQSCPFLTSPNVTWCNETCRKSTSCHRHIVYSILYVDVEPLESRQNESIMPYVSVLPVYGGKVSSSSCTSRDFCLHSSQTTILPIHLRRHLLQDFVNMPRSRGRAAPARSPPSRPTTTQNRQVTPQQQQPNRGASTTAQPPGTRAQTGGQAPGLFGQMASTAA